MAAALRAVALAGRAGPHAAWVALLALPVVVPLLWIGAQAVLAGTDGAAWRALLDDPQWPRALAASLWTGLAATVLSVLCTAAILSRSFGARPWPFLVRVLSPLLAMPHAAFAIGLAFLLAPSGWILRALSPWATGFDAPPDWATTQDPWGLGLIAALVGKEVPFLLWVAASQMQRADAGPRWSRELALARTMGYARHHAVLRA